MGYLFDTHALVWWLYDLDRVPANVQAIVSDPSNAIYASAISAFEIANKHRLGKWPEIAPLAVAFERVLEMNDLEILSVSAEHARLAGLLPGRHRDPFDRLIAAQSRLQGLPVLTADPAFPVLGAEIQW